MEEEFKKLFMDFMSKLANPTEKVSTTDTRIETLLRSMTEFSPSLDKTYTFDMWYGRYEDVFTVDAASLDNAAKTRLLLRKLSNDAFQQYTNHILPLATRDLSFEETISKLKKLFSSQTSLFSKRYNCLAMKKRAPQSYIDYAGLVNRQCEEFGIGSCSVDEFKCLIFVCGLHETQDAEIRKALLAKLEANKSITLENLIAECSRITNLRRDVELVEKNSSEAAVHVVQQPRFTKKKIDASKGSFSPSQNEQKGCAHQKPRTPCWKCGMLHYVRECPYLNHRCKECDRIGHKEGFCQCVQSNPGKRRKGKTSNINTIRTVNHINAQDRRKFVSVIINKAKVNLQLDCASDISIITEDNWKRIGSPPTKKPTVKARTASGQPLPLHAHHPRPGR